MGMYFEDFQPGVEYATGTYVVSEEEIIAFASRYDPQSFHLDHEAARNRHFGGLVASGWMTCGIMMRLVVDHLLKGGSSMGSPGIDQVRWLKPVRPGDTLRVTVYTREVKPSQSKPDRGVVFNQWRAYNQHDELACTLDGMGLFGRREVS